MTDNHRYPALVLDGLTPIDDLFVRLLMPEKRFKRDLITRARIAPSHRVLDRGAGTGRLAIMIKQTRPEAQVTGVDNAQRILAVAREKASRPGAEISFDPGNATVTPPDSSGRWQRLWLQSCRLIWVDHCCPIRPNRSAQLIVTLTIDRHARSVIT